LSIIRNVAWIPHHSKALPAMNTSSRSYSAFEARSRIILLLLLQEFQDQSLYGSWANECLILLLPAYAH